MSQALQSSQSFVRALKAPSDPPQPDGPSKVEIARQAWENTSFYVPNKGEVIVEWLLTKLLKDKSNQSSNPILDARFWTLLCAVILPIEHNQLSQLRSSKTWLTPLLNRIPIAPIILAFLASLHKVASADRPSLSLAVRQCMTIIWPLSAHKVTSDALLDCFGAVMKMSIEDDREANENVEKIGKMIIASFRNAFGNSSNKKKMHQTFTQTHLVNWLECTRRLSASQTSYQDLLSNIYTTGAEIIFALDILRHAQTQVTIASALPGALQTLLSNHPTQVISSLPCLFSSFIQSVRKHRGALFGQSSGSSSAGATTATEVRKASMALFMACIALVDQVQGVDDELIWDTRVKLLEIVDKEMLFSSSGVQMVDDAEGVLRSNGKLAIEAIAHAADEKRGERTKLAVVLLSTLARIDYDLVATSIPQILSRLLLVSKPTEALTLLNLLLDYHTKTRTMHTHINILLSSLSSSSGTSATSRQKYASAFCSPLFNLTHLDRLGKCTLNFLTPGQTRSIADDVIISLRSSWDEFWGAQEKLMADSGNGSRKKRKVASEKIDSIGGTGDPDDMVAGLVLTARIASIILSSLPLHSLTESTRQAVQETLADARENHIRPALRLLLDAIVGNLVNTRGDLWAAQVAAAALLRLEYALVAARPLKLMYQADDKMTGQMLILVADNGVLPELSLEIFRALLGRPQDVGSDTTALESALQYLEGHSTAAWAGLSCQLTFGEAGQGRASLALLHLLLDRWLPVIDLVASKPHLERLARLMITIQLNDTGDSLSSDTLHSRTILNKTLRSAQFWELANMRSAFLSCINAETAPLDQADVKKLNSSRKQKKSPIDEHQLRQAISVYEMLLLIPSEYLPRASRQDFIRRAVAADVVLVRTVHSYDESLNQSLTVLRTFQKRWFLYQSSTDHDTMRKSSQHLIGSLESHAPTDILIAATLDLIDLHLTALLRSPEQKTIIDTIANFSVASSATESQALRIVPLSLLRFFQLVTRDFSMSDFSEPVISSMADLQEKVLSASSSHIIAAIAEGAKPEDLSGQSHLLRVLCAALSLGRWLHKQASVMLIGRPLIMKILPALRSTPASSNKTLQEVCVGALAILLEEFQYCLEDCRLSNLEFVVATYVSFYGLSAADSRAELDLHLSKTCKALPISDFSCVLDLCKDALAGSGLSSNDLACVVHLATLLLREAPQGTLKVIQAFTTHCFNLFASYPIFYSGSLPLRLQALNFVAQHCSDRPAALRSQDLSSTWLLLSNSLSGSEKHDNTTSITTFHSVISIVSALIRLRRDLVICTLPHLGMILRQLIMIIRQLRPQLGAKQSKMVTDTLPIWVNTAQPLGADEGKALARLLTTLTSKSIVRVHHHSSAALGDTQKAESLAKPFSKHAAYVLKAYIDAMNDPLCVLPLDLRNELQPGLFALCDMLSEHSRDAIMVSGLDVGGKTTMKSLWKEYEKQKYVGKG